MQMKERLNKKSKWSWNHTTMYWIAGFWMNSTVQSWAMKVLCYQTNTKEIYLIKSVLCSQYIIHIEVKELSREDYFTKKVSLLMTVFEWIHLKIKKTVSSGQGSQFFESCLCKC